MREIRTSGSMSGEGKRSDGHRPQVTAPLLDSTLPLAVIALVEDAGQIRAPSRFEVAAQQMAWQSQIMVQVDTIRAASGATLTLASPV